MTNGVRQNKKTTTAACAKEESGLNGFKLHSLFLLYTLEECIFTQPSFHCFKHVLCAKSFSHV